MESRRRLAVVPSLARLLGDLPRNRVATLCDIWDAGLADRPGVAASLYRGMTNRERQASVIASLDQATRLVLDRLCAAPSGLTAGELAARVPFTDDAVGRCLDQLAERGIAWRSNLQRGASVEAAERWLVPRDLAVGLRAATHPTKDGKESAHSGGARISVSSPGLARAVVDLSRVRVGGPARQQLAAYVSDHARVADEGPAEANLRSFARAAGLALGVLNRRGRVVGLGARATAWAALTPSEQTRALARVWLVDDGVAGTVPVKVRAALAAVLVATEVGGWYRVDSVAREVAMRGALDELAPHQSVSSRVVGAIDRSTIDRAIEALRWIGVVDVVADARERPEAIRVTTDGQYALHP